MGNRIIGRGQITVAAIKDGTSVTATSVVTYQGGTSGTVIPTGTWQTIVPTVAPGSYLWTRTIISFSNGKSSTAYSVSLMGKTGATGNTGSPAVNFEVLPGDIIIDEYDKTPGQTSPTIALRNLPVTITVLANVGTSANAGVTISNLTGDGTVCKGTSSASVSGNKIVLSSLSGGTNDIKGSLTFTAAYGGKTQSLTVNIYVNRVSSLSLTMKGDIYSMQSKQTEFQTALNGKVSQTTYNSFLTSNSKELSSVKTATTKLEDNLNSLAGGATNFFGFNKGIEFSNNIPAVQAYGYECVYTSDNQLGRIQNLKLGSAGDFVISGKIASVNGYITKANLNLCDGTSVDFNSGGYNISGIKASSGTEDSWLDFEVHFKNVTAYLDAPYYGFLDCEPIGASNFYNDRILIRNLKIERGTVKTQFDICAEDNDVITSTTLVSSLDTANAQIVDEKLSLFGSDFDVYKNSIHPAAGSYLDLAFKNGIQISDNTCYTLSFWAKSDIAGTAIASYLYPTMTAGIANFINADIANNVQSITNRDDGSTTTPLSTSWKHYYVRWYTWGSTRILNFLPIRICYSDGNASSNIYFANIELFKGFVNNSNYSISSSIVQKSNEIKVMVGECGIDIKNKKITLNGSTEVTEDFTTKSLQTTPSKSGSFLTLKESECAVYSNAHASPGIKFGVDDNGVACLNLYDKNGTLKYILSGTYGLLSANQTVIAAYWEEMGIIMKCSSTTSLANVRNIPNRICTNPLYFYRFNSQVNNGKIQDLLHNLMIFTKEDTSLSVDNVAEDGQYVIEKTFFDISNTNAVGSFSYLKIASGFGTPKTIYFQKINGEITYSDGKGNFGTSPFVS